MNAGISQSDCLTAYGDGIDALWDGLLTGKTAIRATDRFIERNFVSDQAAMVPDLQVEKDESRMMALLQRVLSPLARTLDPQTPIILATTVGEIEQVEQSILQNSPQRAQNARPQILLQRIKELLGLAGRGILVSSACASSTAALCCAASIIRRGEAQNVLVVTADAVSEFVYSGFSTLLSLSDGGAKPFDAGRCGLSLGEAAAWALISADRTETSILGWGNTTDAVHMTAPDRTGGGLCRAISKACAMSGKSPGDIAFIAAHGTATIYSDAMELLAFKKSLPNPKPIFSVKGAVGHTLAAAGLLQILVTARAMSRGVVPPTVGLNNPDPDAVGWARGQAVEIGPSTVALATNSGFGGVNTAVLLGQEQRVVIHALAWFNQDFHGVLSNDGAPWQKPSPDLADADALLQLLGRSVKYLSRMPPQTRACLCAASVALGATKWSGEIGLLAAGQQGCLSANQEYFQDYVASGRTLGRGNLFIYTLTTSTLGEIAIALGLAGPSMYFHEDSQPLAKLIAHAESLVTDKQADGVLALWSDDEAAVCIAVGPDERDRKANERFSLLHIGPELSPTELAKQLSSKVHRS